MVERAISAEEAHVLSLLHQRQAPVSPRELLEHSSSSGLSALGVRAAILTLVDRGAARFTADSKFEAVEG
jgi:hypothetical protein